MFDKAEVHHLPRLRFDHAPILVHCFSNRPITGMAPFKFQPMWLTHSEFAKFVHDHWSVETGNINNARPFGDASARFFHTSTNIRRHKNNINMISGENGAWITNHGDISEHITNFFSGLYTSDTSYSTLLPPFLDSLQPFTTASHLSLNTQFFDKEILMALKSFKPYKTPGPDGLHPIFFHKCWPSIEKVALSTIHNAFMNYDTISEINSTYICLIPKVDRPESVKQYRHISLCNTIYKCLTKLLVN
ncbi:hypothetical protein LIER_42053 [Lithospermum erythrorhizon]|uniref:Reverse transcriptase n=1 Tax=Lithospermum erythrorhizon TaxID=34254 RepID=A0AAV3RPL7_LITER